jgi:uncharacterized protein (DUF885 family)
VKITNYVKYALFASMLTLLACSQQDPEQQQVNTTAADAPQDTTWDGFLATYLEGFFKLNPATAVYQGKHELDGQLPDWSASGLQAQIDFAHKSLEQAAEIDTQKMSEAQRFERDYFVSVIEGQLFWLEDVDWPHRNPTYYLERLDPDVYIARPYASADIRMQAFIEYAKSIPAAAAQIKTNLQLPLSETYLKLGTAGFSGFADYFTGDAKAAFAEVADVTLQSQFDVAAAAAAQAMQALSDHLNSQTATKDGFAIGAANFSKMLAKTEGVNISLQELEAAGRADLKRNQDALAVACKQFAPDASIVDCMAKMAANKPENGPVQEARDQLPALKAFLLEKDLVSIPGTEEALVEESPPYNRQNSAYISIPGPYEDGLPSVYYISPPDPSWDAQTRAAYIPGKLDLLFTSIHEIWPGHFLNFLHSNRAESLFGKLFVGYAFAEGWAHYSEEMMMDAGLHDGDAETKVGQLMNALLRNCRFISAIALHAQGMTVEESYEMFRNECYQDAGNATQQAARGTYDPAYLNYTMGKLMIRKLREDWTATRGGRDAWKAFHDEFLSYGGPPIPMVRQAMMKEDSARAVF